MPEKVAFGFDISGRHCNAKTESFAVKVAELLSGFIAGRAKAGMSEGRLRRLRSSAWEIGHVVCRRGFLDGFSPEIFADPDAIIHIQRTRAHFDLTDSFRRTCAMLAEHVEAETAGKL